MSAETQKDDADQPPQTPGEKQVAELKVAVDQPGNGDALRSAQARIDQAIVKISAEDSSLPEITPEMRQKVEKITLEMQVLSRQAAELQREIMPHLDALSARMHALDPKLQPWRDAIKSGIIAPDAPFSQMQESFPDVAAAAEEMVEVIKTTFDLARPLFELLKQSTDKMQELSRVMLSDTQIATIERAVQESVE